MKKVLDNTKYVRLFNNVLKIENLDKEHMSFHAIPRCGLKSRNSQGVWTSGVLQGNIRPDLQEVLKMKTNYRSQPTRHTFFFLITWISSANFCKAPGKMSLLQVNRFLDFKGNWTVRKIMWQREVLECFYCYFGLIMKDSNRSQILL